MEKEIEQLPQFLINLLQQQYGEKLTEKIIDGYKAKRKVTFRVNTIKSNVEEIEKELKNNNIEFEKILFFNDAFIIKNAVEKDLQDLAIYKER